MVHYSMQILLCKLGTVKFSSVWFDSKCMVKRITSNCSAHLSNDQVSVFFYLTRKIIRHVVERKVLKESTKLLLISLATEI